ncbi:hypothetical protein C8F04DRAFT_1277650 [Mycena alexandri]|uniref:Uncharacterized protein n=1 Tax=Mycena alexandri TaxID=1745969 RepID=A0AAD6S0D7_9AGAR|nr:hypothetical protein C8F04DRAFT_1277650 [Mycena alexandri]
MPAVYSTVAAASAARRRPDQPPKKSAPLTADQQKEKREARSEKQGRMDEQVRKWMEDTNETAEKMAAEFDVKPRYILDIFFQGGTHMINHQEVVNPYNAFKSFKAAEIREEGGSKDAAELHADHFEEYRLLTDKDKKKHCTDFEKVRKRNFSLHRDTPHGKIQDVSNIVHNMKMLMFGLSQRVGIEGFFCIVRNNVEFRIEPEWYFTSKELENYMEIVTRKRWVTGEVGMKFEVFAIAGCNPVNMLRNAKQKIDFMKGEMRAILAKGLADVSKVPGARLAWTWFEEDIVQRYGVVLEGWTAGAKIMDPSKLSSSLTVIRTLLDAVKAGQCGFRKLGPMEAALRRKTWDADVAAGNEVAKHRASRSDAGVPRKRARDEEEDNENDPLLPDDTTPPTTTGQARARWTE